MDILQGRQLPRFLEPFADFFLVLAAEESVFRVSRNGEIHGPLCFIVDAFVTL